MLVAYETCDRVYPPGLRCFTVSIPSISMSSSSSLVPKANDLDSYIGMELYETCPDCIKVLGLDGTIKRLSPGGKIALELDHANQLDGAAWASLWPDNERARIESAVTDGQHGRSSQFLAFCPTAKNTPRWWDVVVTPVQDASGATSELLVVSRDVTELVLTKRALALANERKDIFLAALSHELRNPLSALSMAAKVLETQVNVPQASKISELIHRQVGHMSRLTEDLLDVSRITRGQVNLQVEEFDLRDSIDDATEQLAARLSSKSQILQKQVPPTPVMIHGDRMRLGQVLGNLIANASRYSSSNSSIKVAVAIDGQSASITVSDQGRGIAADAIPTLFDLYSQGQVTADRKESGVGMGLAIVKGLVELHGGKIRVASDGPGMGSTFFVSLPVPSSMAGPADAS